MNRWIEVYHHQEQSLVLPGAKSTSVESNHVIMPNVYGTENDALDLYDIYMISIHPSLRRAARWIGSDLDGECWREDKKTLLSLH